MRNQSKILFFVVLGTVFGAKASWARSLHCTHYVTPTTPFCSVTLEVLDDGTLDKHAEIEHYGQKMQTILAPLPTKENQWFHLNLDSDKPGKEIEMIIDHSANGQAPFPAVLINPEVPFGKEMKGTCEWGK